MKKSRLLGAVCACLSILTVNANAAFIGRLPATPDGTDYQAYYDDQLNLTWATDALINGEDTWDNHTAWVAGLTIGGVSGWHLPSVDVNGDGTVVDCSISTQAECKDNEYDHLYHYGAGPILGTGITVTTPGPFINLMGHDYWSSTEVSSEEAWEFHRFFGGSQVINEKPSEGAAWAVHSGDVAAVPLPAAAWLFGSGLLGLIGMARRKV